MPWRRLRWIKRPNGRLRRGIVSDSRTVSKFLLEAPSELDQLQDVLNQSLPYVTGLMCPYRTNRVHSGKLRIIMPFLKGTMMNDHMRDNQNDFRNYFNEIVALWDQMEQRLGGMGIRYGDFKPENILLTKEGAILLDPDSLVRCSAIHSWAHLVKGLLFNIPELSPLHVQLIQEAMNTRHLMIDQVIFQLNLIVEKKRRQGEPKKFERRVAALSKLLSHR